MRNAVKLKQNVWFCRVDEEIEGLDTVRKYSKPIKKRFSVSATAGTPEEIAAGIVPTYDRFITSFDRDFKVEEGTTVFVDTVPKIGLDGELVLSDDGVTPVTLPDYVIKKNIGTKQGSVFRYGIVKIGDADA